MWSIKLKGFIRQGDLSYSQGYDDDGEEGEDDNVKNDNDKDNMNEKVNNDEIFFKSIRCFTFSEPRAQAEVNDDSEYNKGDKRDKNVKVGNNDNKIFISKVSGVIHFSLLQAQSEVNDDNNGEDNKNVQEDNNDNKTLVLKSINCHTYHESSIVPARGGNWNWNWKW